MTQEERIRSIEHKLQIWTSRILKLQKEFDSIKRSVDSDSDDDELFEVIKTTAVAYSNKKSIAQDLAGAIGEATSGQYPINGGLMTRPTLARYLLKQSQDVASMGKAMKRTVMPLTRRETQILNCIADGNTNKQIALILQTSEQTVKNQVSAIFRKLNANDRAHAVAIAMSNSLILAERKGDAMVAVS